jgi:excisionase family DNA binding protein
MRMEIGDPLPGSPWLNIVDACLYARVSSQVIYRAIADRRLRAARVDGRRKLVVKREWLDAWLTSAAPDIDEAHRSHSFDPATRSMAHPPDALRDQDRIASEILHASAAKRPRPRKRR